MVSDMVAVGVISEAEDFVVASGTQAELIESNARALALIGGFSNAVGITFIVIGAVAYGSLIIISGAVPRLLGGLSVVAGLVILFFWLSLAVGPFWIVGLIGFIGQMVFQLLFGG